MLAGSREWNEVRSPHEVVFFDVMRAVMHARLNNPLFDLAWQAIRRNSERVTAKLRWLLETSS
jgi:hypothetical protein